ncbi:MAG: hypothetical protein ACXVJW_04020 [Acidimicrobiia bacterium]
MFVFWSTVRGGPLGGIVALLAYGMTFLVIGGAYALVPGLPPLLVVPAFLIPIVLIYRIETRRERTAGDRAKDRYPV